MYGIFRDVFAFVDPNEPGAAGATVSRPSDVVGREKPAAAADLQPPGGRGDQADPTAFRTSREG